MENIVYDRSFNANEWFTIAMIVIGGYAVWKLPRRFSPPAVLFHLLIGVFFGLLFDHTIAIPPYDFYDVGDQSKYQLLDVFSYAMYMPFGYIFIYFYELFKIRTSYLLIAYILLWSAMGIAVEWLSVLAGIFHYKNGYRIAYSIPVYITVTCIHLWIYCLLFKKNNVR
ncbi:hypothetical protein [Paenibacillus gansuensis]|uniref:Uncharacterized protein n=1 Tax=Paenibacillus gansuensis TaxID=306542 RepID=A0ABW5PAY9_9BACL